MIYIQSTLRNAPHVCRNASLSELFGNNGNIHTVFTQANMCVHTNVLHTAETVVGQKKFKIHWDSSEWRVPRKFFRVPFWTCVP
jgi:hypothetical protein